MEREIQVISRGALGNAMQPGQCPRRPPPALCKMGNFWREGGGTGTERLQLPPESPRGAERPSPAPVVLPVGPRGGWEPGCPPIGCVSVGAKRQPLEETSRWWVRGWWWAWPPLAGHRTRAPP